MNFYTRIKHQLRSKQYKLKEYNFTSESVSEGHPDKMADQISDAILDVYLKHDPQARVAIETFVAPNNVIVGGEVASTHVIKKTEVESIIRHQVKHIGYQKDPFHYQNIKITNLIHKQSADIAIGVSKENQNFEGAGDQGIMFGYACRETDVLMPAPIYYAHKLMKNIMDATKTSALKGLGPDAKCQVTLTYDKLHKPYKADNIVVSIQHKDSLSQDDVKKMIRPFVEKTLPKGWMCEDYKLLVNPTGKFVIAGPESDAGLTGRKIIVDTYGGAAPHGGGAFSGKDPSKVDRSAAYAARYIAKNVVAAHLADICLIQISYAIGIAKPLSIYINTFGTAHYHEDRILSAITKSIDLSPRGIRNHLKLDRAIYLPTAAYGHFGRMPTEEGCFSWEKTDLVDQLRAHIKKQS